MVSCFDNPLTVLNCMLQLTSTYLTCMTIWAGSGNCIGPDAGSVVAQELAQLRNLQNLDLG